MDLVGLLLVCADDLPKGVPGFGVMMPAQLIVPTHGGTKTKRLTCVIMPCAVEDGNRGMAMVMTVRRPSGEPAVMPFMVLSKQTLEEVLGVMAPVDA